MRHALHASLGTATLSEGSVDIEPNSHILFRAQVRRDATDLDGTVQACECLDLAMRVTSYGGLLTEARRRPSDPDQALHLTALMTVAQVVEMLFDHAQEEVGVRVLDSGGGAAEGVTNPISTWLGAEQEDVRSVGVAMLTRVLQLSGIGGDVEAAADQLWTSCGY